MTLAAVTLNEDLLTFVIRSRGIVLKNLNIGANS